MGQDADTGGYNGRPRSSGSPQKTPKFGPALGRAGRYVCPFLIWVGPLGADFTQTDQSNVRLSVWVAWFGDALNPLGSWAGNRSCGQFAFAAKEGLFRDCPDGCVEPSQSKERN
jgi:hypothetical protein